MTYFEFVAKAVEFDLIDWPAIQVTEQSLTEEEIEQWKSRVSLHGPLSSSAVSAFGCWQFTD